MKKKTIILIIISVIVFGFFVWLIVHNLSDGKFVHDMWHKRVSEAKLWELAMVIFLSMFSAYRLSNIK